MTFKMYRFTLLPLGNHIVNFLTMETWLLAVLMKASAHAVKHSYEQSSRHMEVPVKHRNGICDVDFSVPRIGNRPSDGADGIRC
jgi:hypothetical protein